MRARLKQAPRTWQVRIGRLAFHVEARTAGHAVRLVRRFLDRQALARRIVIPGDWSRRPWISVEPAPASASAARPAPAARA